MPQLVQLPFPPSPQLPLFPLFPPLSIIFMLLLLFPQPSTSFLFNHASHPDQCYQLDLENCFREAFLSAMHPPLRRRRKEMSASSYYHVAFNQTMGHEKRDSRTFFLCHDVRRLTSCFLYPGCSDSTAAAVASVQYHMVFGKKLPMHVFLAYKGLGKEMCEEECSRDTIFVCRRTMSREEQEEQEAALLEMSTLSGHISPEKDNMGTCERYKTALLKVLRSRVSHCPESARCTCDDASTERVSAICGVDCPRLSEQEARARLNSSPNHISLAISILVVLLFA